MSDGSRARGRDAGRRARRRPRRRARARGPDHVRRARRRSTSRSTCSPRSSLWEDHEPRHLRRAGRAALARLPRRRPAGADRGARRRPPGQPARPAAAAAARRADGPRRLAGRQARPRASLAGGVAALTRLGRGPPLRGPALAGRRRHRGRRAPRRRSRSTASRSTPSCPAAGAVLVAVAVAHRTARPPGPLALAGLAVVAAAVAVGEVRRRWPPCSRRSSCGGSPRGRPRRPRAVALAGGLGAAGVALPRACTSSGGAAGPSTPAATTSQQTGEASVMGVEPDYVGRTLRLVAPARRPRLRAGRLGAGLAARRRRRCGALARRRPDGLGRCSPCRSLAGWAIATWAALTMHGFWWPGRQVVVVLPLLLVAVLWWADRVAGPLGRAAAALLGLVGLAATAALLRRRLGPGDHLGQRLRAGRRPALLLGPGAAARLPRRPRRRRLAASCRLDRRAGRPRPGGLAAGRRPTGLATYDLRRDHHRRSTTHTTPTTRPVRPAGDRPALTRA